MSLSDYQPERQEIVLKKGSFTVAGLSLNDLALLIKTHLSDLDGVFALFSGGIASDMVEAQHLATQLATEAPGLAANIIALAAGEPGATAQASALPFPVQVETLQVIGRLTFEEVGGVKKALVTMLDLLSHLMPEVPAAPPKTKKKAR